MTRTRYVAGFTLLVVVQVLHLGEHTIQMIQLYVWHLPPTAARGLISPLDVEKVHFFWNLVVLAALVWLLETGRRTVWLWMVVGWTVLHTAEHGFLLARALASGLEGQPGILGAGGWLARHGWNVAGLTTWSRPTVHFAWNLGEVVLLLAAYLAVVGRGRYAPPVHGLHCRPESSTVAVRPSLGARLSAPQGAEPPG